MSILITGSEGFLGTQLTKILIQKKKKFIGLSRNKKNSLKYNFIKIDLREIKKIKEIIKKNKIKILIHCAWHTDTKNFYKSKINYSNLKNSNDLLKIFKNNGGKKFIGIGTCAEHYFTNNNLIQFPFKSTYGKAKYDLYNKIRNCKIQFNWFRLYWLFGEGDRRGRILSELSKSIKSKKKLKINEPNNLRDYMAIEDVAKIIYKIIFDLKLNGLFEICSGKGINNTEIANIFSELSGVPLDNFAKIDKISKNSQIITIIGENNLIKNI